MCNYNKKQNFIQEPQEEVLSSGTFDYIQKTLKRFTKSKSRTKKFINFATPKLSDNSFKLTKKTLENVSACGSWLEFRDYYEVDKVKLHNANFCKKDKLCPACAMRRASKQVEKVFNYINQNETLLKKNWYYIVLPVRHSADEDFETVFNRARSGLQLLRNSIKDYKRGKGHKSFFSQFEGFLYSFEVTKTKNGWNNHINLLCYSDNPITGIYKKGKTFIHDDIIRDWAKYTDNNSYIHSINQIDISTKDKLIKNLLEVFKYSLKFQDLKDEDLFEVYEKTYRKRLLGGLGSLYNLKLDVDLKEEELGKKFLEIIYRYNYETDEYFEYSRTKRDYVKPLKDKPYRKKVTFDMKKTFNRKQKVIPIAIYSPDGLIIKKFNKRILENISDYEIYKNSLILYE